MTTGKPERSAPEEPTVQARPSTRRLFFTVWGQAWLLTILGGGACGAVCAGFLSLVFFFLTIPGGMYLGALLGLPLGLVIAIAVTRHASPPEDPLRLTRRLENVGIGIAMLITASINLYLEGALLFAADVDNRVLGVLAQIPNGLIAVLVSAIIGRECGHLLAARQLKRFGLTPPPRRSVRHPWRNPGQSGALGR